MACLAACLMVWFVGGWLFGIMCAWFVVPCCSAGWLNVCLGNVIDWPVRDMVGWLMGWFLGVFVLAVWRLVAVMLRVCLLLVGWSVVWLPVWSAD